MVWVIRFKVVYSRLHWICFAACKHQAVRHYPYTSPCTKHICTVHGLYNCRPTPSYRQVSMALTQRAADDANRALDVWQEALPWDCYAE